MLIRRETRADRSAVFAVQKAAFATVEGGVPVEATLVVDLHVAGDSVAPLSFVAEAGGMVIGHALVSWARIGERRTVALGPLGVHPDHQGRGVGSALVHTLLGAADALGEAAVVLLGSPSYYGRFGFQPAVPLDVLPPQPEWAEHFQLRTLSAWTGDITGPFRYAAAFDNV